MKEKLQIIANCFELGCRDTVLEFLEASFASVQDSATNSPYKLYIKVSELDGKGSSHPIEQSWQTAEDMTMYFQRLYTDRYGFKHDSAIGIPASFLEGVLETFGD